MHLQQVTFRALPELVAALDKAARHESQRLDLPVDRCWLKKNPYNLDKQTQRSRGMAISRAFLKSRTSNPD